MCLGAKSAVELERELDEATERGSSTVPMPTDGNLVTKWQIAQEWREARWAESCDISGISQVTVAVLTNPPYEGGAVTGLIRRLPDGSGVQMLPIFQVTYHPADGKHCTVEYMDLPTLCANKWSCWHEALCPAIGYYYTDVAKTQVAQNRALIQAALQAVRQA